MKANSMFLWGIDNAGKVGKVPKINTIVLRKDTEKNYILKNKLENKIESTENRSISLPKHESLVTFC